jgi:uncharacterized protein (DUF2147 family)
MTCFTTLFLGFAALIPADCQAAAPGLESVQGFWRPPDGGRIEIHACGDLLCAHVRDDGVDNGKPTYDGHLLLERLQYQGGLFWAHGLVHDPSDHRTYEAKLRLLNGNRLKLTGCAWIFCGSQVWTRIE